MQSHSQGSGRLTTHVLDTALGKPAEGLRIELFRVEGDVFHLLKTTETNDDGRCDAPLLSGETMKAGTYELRFHAGEMTQAELAQRIGMTRQTIVAIEAGKYSPSLEAAFRIAVVLRRLQWCDGAFVVQFAEG